LPFSSNGISDPYWYSARRVITLPAMMFSETAASRNPSGAITRTVPAATSSSEMTPLTPP
jgi:hypothetical protein